MRATPWRGRVLGAAAGLALDRWLGEPPTRAHPVALFGLVMTDVERRLWRDSVAAGAAHALVGLGIGAVGGHVAGSTTVATYVAAGGRGLGDAATEVARALEAHDLAAARRLLPRLVGRDPDELDEPGIARAVVESVAENTVDAVIATGLWAALGGAAGAFAHRAVNTMDAMVGYRSARYRRYGIAAALLDDVMAWLPARLTAALVAAVRPRRAPAVWRAVRRDAPAHPSPNAGVAEAAFAAALGLRLGGPTRYGGRWQDRPHLGDGGAPAAVDIPRAVRLSSDATLALGALLLAVGAGGWAAKRTLDASPCGCGRSRRAKPPTGTRVAVDPRGAP